jgi:hypothetical protein
MVVVVIWWGMTALFGRDRWLRRYRPAPAFRISFFVLLETFLQGHSGEDVGDEVVNRLLVILDYFLRYVLLLE